MEKTKLLLSEEEINELSLFMQEKGTVYTPKVLNEQEWKNLEGKFEQLALMSMG